MTVQEVREKIEQTLLNRAASGRSLAYGTFGVFKASNGNWAARESCCPIGACLDGQPSKGVETIFEHAAKVLGITTGEVDSFVRGFDNGNANFYRLDTFYVLGCEFRARWLAGEFRPAR